MVVAAGEGVPEDLEVREVQGGLEDPADPGEAGPSGAAEEEPAREEELGRPGHPARPLCCQICRYRRREKVVALGMGPCAAEASQPGGLHLGPSQVRGEVN